MSPPVQPVVSDEKLPGSADVVVIGGGIAGSAAAYALAKKDLSVALLDKGRVGGERITRQLDKIWTKYTGNPPPYGLRDPAIDEKRVLFICNVDRIATFGKP